MKLKLIMIIMFLISFTFVNAYDYIEVEDYDSFNNTVLKVDYDNATLEVVIFSEWRYCSKVDDKYCDEYYDKYKEGKVNGVVSDYIQSNLVVIESYDLSDLTYKIILLEERILFLESLLNITIEPEEAKLYSCVSDNNLGRECPYGFSNVNKDGLVTRCYTAQLFGVNTLFDYCSSGWNEVK